MLIASDFKQCDCNLRAIKTMPSLTPLHETYCRFDDSPLSQADVLEGLAQLLTSRLGSTMHYVVFAIQREMLMNFLGINDLQSQKIFQLPYIKKLYQFTSDTTQHYSKFLLAPSLRHLIEAFPNLHHKSLNPTLHFLVGILNGVLGNYLQHHHNPLALPMLLYDHYGEVQKGDLAGKVIIFIHGVCMSHVDWTNARHGSIPDKLLAQRGNKTILYLNYNSGRRISANGRSLATILANLQTQNPQITSIDLIGHSMGGLIARSALFYGKQEVHDWVYMTENLVCLGSPHHGAGLERFSFTIQQKLGSFPIMKLFGHLVNIRSNGILDLRHGSVRDDDWEHHDMRIGLLDDSRKPAPLPSHIRTFLVAGTLEYGNKKNIALKILGDYLVSVSSALGEHPNPRFHLKVPDAHKAVFYGLNHFEIQYHSSVAELIAGWLYPGEHHHDDDLLHEIVIETDAVDDMS